jgi:zinc/manganese transport system permease protein
MVIILDKSSGSDVHIHDMLTGAILWVAWPEVIRLAIVVSIVGVFHWVFRKKMTSLTDSYDDCTFNPGKRKLWDFLFYFSFGLVIVEAVQIGGILTVFALLIIPASTTLLFFSSWRSRIIAGLLLALLLTIPALWVSWTWDLPASPVLILFLGITLIVSGIVYQIIKRRKA